MYSKGEFSGLRGPLFRRINMNWESIAGIAGFVQTYHCKGLNEKTLQDPAIEHGL